MIKINRLGLAAFLVAMLSLVMTSSAMAASPFPSYTVTALPNETVTYDFAVQAPGVTINQILSTGSCTFDGLWKVKYTVLSTAQVGDPDISCNIAVVHSGGVFDTALFTIKVGAPPDTTDPVVTITSPADGTTFTTSTTTFTFGVSDNVDPSPSCDNTSGSTVTLVPGSNTITVNCTDASGNTGSDTVTVTYMPPPSGDPIKVNLHNVQIREEDTNVVAHIPITLSRASPVPITLKYTTEEKQATNSDFVAIIDGSVTIPAGQTSGEILITIIGDNYKESSDNFFVVGDLTIESEAYATLQKDQATVVIQNDDT